MSNSVQRLGNIALAFTNADLLARSALPVIPLYGHVRVVNPAEDDGK